MRKKEILPFVTPWMDFEGIMLSEISQIEKDQYYMVSLTCEIRPPPENSQNQRTEEWLPGARGWMS